MMASVELLPIGQICDRIKTFQQTAPISQRNGVSIPFAIRSIWLQGGRSPSEFFAGARWNLINSCAKHAFRFPVIVVVDEFWERLLSIRNETVLDESKKIAIHSTLSAVSFSLIETTLIKCPMDSLKTKDMTRHLFSSSTTSSSSSFWAKYNPNLNSSSKASVFSVLYQGYTSVLVRQSVSWISFRLALDETTLFFNRIKNRNSNQQQTVLDSLAIATIAGMINVTIVSPFDVISTQSQQFKPRSPSSSSYFQIWKEIYRKQGGARFFFRGWQIKSIRSIWYSFVYQIFMQNSK